MTWTATPQRCLVLALLCLVALPGCTVCQNLRRTMCREPGAYSWKRDRARSLALYQEWANEAWARECNALGGPATPEYRAGFTDGFVDYVYAGGNGEPPPIPPREFWNADMRSPQGRQLANEWFAGYRHGAQTAQVGGYRDSVTMSTSLLGTEFATTEFSPSYLPDEGDLPVPELELPAEMRDSARSTIDHAPHEPAINRASQTYLAAIVKNSSSTEEAARADSAPAAQRPDNSIAAASHSETRPHRTSAPLPTPPTVKMADANDAARDETTLRIVPDPSVSIDPPPGEPARSRRRPLAHEFIR
jgi:hypothetical protein